MRGPQCPPSLRYLWDWFIELSNTRDYGDGGPAAIKPSEINEWASFTIPKPSHHEKKIILALDVKFRNIHAEDESDYHKLSDEEKQVVQYVNAAMALTKRV